MWVIRTTAVFSSFAVCVASSARFGTRHTCGTEGPGNGGAMLQKLSESALVHGKDSLGSATDSVELQRSADLSLAFQLMAKQAKRKETAAFLSSLRICTRCKNYRRFGQWHDGGYLTCMDGVVGADGSNKLSAAFSLGVEKHDQWSADVSNMLGLPVNQFDCTVASAAPCRTCNFFPKCLRSASGKGTPPNHGGESWTFQDMLDKTGQATAPEHSILLKIDIEGAEWPYFAEEHESILNKFQQIIVEFHKLSDEPKHRLYLQAVRKIQQAGLQVAHLHGNNFAGMYEVGDAKVPNVLEVTFIRGPRDHCVDDQQELLLDAPNNPLAPELPLAHIPEKMKRKGKRKRMTRRRRRKS